ncbi:hypothetical protein GCM10020369_78130 [Cryptosporangium minutisporangium]|uniref:Aminoglycoside phosphotransferase domain-containing protein n=1 Tax=Cryptosporangium minutisporangium TaxID=113569 RepID=A0ABP6TBU5_9ACTN
MGAHAPELVAVSTDQPAIVVTAYSGLQLSEARIERSQEVGAYRQAGELLRQFHGAGPPWHEPDLTVWLAERGEYWLSRGLDILTAAEVADVRAHLQELTGLGPIPPVPCHLDFMPRNLLVRPDGEVGVIDFEHSRYDLAARDLVRLASRIWASRPDLEAAFLAGYGALDDRDGQIIAHCTPLDSVTGFIRGAAS